ncbi:4Fe-4S binding protein [Helicobacter sp. 11S03491-1]|uniref:4Fe-4S binding protein n=1 Tax=Helicobacter sp. 11S03491-1 TaxID=1476196 RepID=UPI0015DA6A97|nr:4Fe-4S binding protein [Helicobacter sp. 11S03491-1]
MLFKKTSKKTSWREVFIPKTPNVLFLPYEKNSSEFCAQCEGECVSVCEEKIIIKQKGAIPYLDFQSNGCIFCKKCAQICEEYHEEEGVLDSSLEDKILGRAEIMELSCFAYQGVICSSCKDICNGSIKFAGMFYPHVLETCTGCGLCISRCPQGSIQVIALKDKKS